VIRPVLGVCCRVGSDVLRIVVAMRELRFVGSAAGGDHVIVADADGEEQFRLRVDRELHAAMAPAAASPPPTGEATTITPRDIQVRVRAGESPEGLAAEAKLPLEKILVFAGPVLAERQRIIDEARRSRANRGSPAGQLVTFGPAVDDRFTAQGIEPSSVQWDACRRGDGQWLISATWPGGERDRTAQWSVALARRMVSPVDETAADLLSDRPIRPIAAAVPEAQSIAAWPTVTTYHRTAAATPDAQTRPLPSVAPQQRWHHEPSAEPATDDGSPPPFARAPEPEPVRNAAARRSEGRRPRTRGASSTGREPTEHPRVTRTHVPSWDDIMLGVRRKQD
jgi:hypothetical protein